mmetsp:Transcript_48314/g.113040  ORF Transcript_48314/g.113040 Transcript_48314/m.113040 type:complete len:219 (+) Transcript_48314:605-1261(+)
MLHVLPNGYLEVALGNLLCRFFRCAMPQKVLVQGLFQVGDGHALFGGVPRAEEAERQDLTVCIVEVAGCEELEVGFVSLRCLDLLQHLPLVLHVLLPHLGVLDALRTNHFDRARALEAGCRQLLKQGNCVLCNQELLVKRLPQRIFVTVRPVNGQLQMIQVCGQPCHVVGRISMMNPCVEDNILWIDRVGVVQHKLPESVRFRQSIPDSTVVATAPHM